MVRQAKAQRPLSYSSLAEEVGIPNPRNLNYVLGAIGNALIELGEEFDEQIPPIQCLIVNKATGIPGEGISSFLDNNNSFRNGTNRQKKAIVDKVLAEIYLYPDWDWVLEVLELEPLKNGLVDGWVKKISKKQRGSGGESEQHRKFKELIAQNPTLIGLDKNTGHGKVEYILPSTDTVDILFEDKNSWTGVEVKSKISSKEDILRGIFQCIKYQALIEAKLIVLNMSSTNCRTILVLEGTFPVELLGVKNQLGVEVIDNVTADN